MDVHLPIIELSAQPLLYLWRSLKKDVRVHLSIAAYTKSLTNLVTNKGEDRTLFASVGNADFIAPWLTRLFAEHASNPEAKRPRLRRLVVKHIGEELAEKLQALGVLEPTFTASLQSNLEKLRSDPYIKKHGIAVDLCTWDGLPAFHGYLYQDRILVGSWMVNEGGHLHVKTPLFEASHKSAPEQYKAVRSAFGT